MFILDWSDTGDCHDHDGVHRDVGPDLQGHIRRSPAGRAVDLSRLDENELAALHRHPNEWFVRQARRSPGRPLGARRAAGRSQQSAPRATSHQEPDPVRKLRALWSLYVIGAADRCIPAQRLLDHEHESVRAWAIRLLTDDLPLDTVYSRRVGPDVEPPAELLAKLIAMARDDPSGLVRLVLASTLQRLPVKRRTELARALLSHAEDAADHNLPALIWTGLIPVAETDPGRARLAGIRLPACRRSSG